MLRFKWFVLSAGIVVVCANAAFAVKGRAVSVAWRYSNLNWGQYNPACPENNMYNWAERGSIVRFDIDGASVSCDTIHRSADRFAMYPALDISGTKVAFFRFGFRLVTDPSTGNGTIAQSGPGHISVVNIDGSGVRDLCELPAAPDDEAALDWPAGDWIYYVRGKLAIWRVNVVTGANEQVLSVNDGRQSMPADAFIRRFGMNLTADRASVQGVNFGWNCNGAYCFPMPGGTINTTGCSIGYAGSCNASISTSGGYQAGYSNTAHDVVELSKLPGGIGPSPYQPSVQDIRLWSGAIIDGVPIAGDGEVIRWAVNSDKWVLQQLGWHGHASEIAQGTNQVLANWVDRQAVVTSANPKIARETCGVSGKPDCCGGCGTVYYGNCPGDFWVDGGSGNRGKYEGADGLWRAVPGIDPTGVDYQPVGVNRLPNGMRGSEIARLSAAVDIRGTITIATAASMHVRILTVSGKEMYSSACSGVLRLSTNRFPAGVYLVHADGLNRNLVTSLVVPR